MSYESSSAKIGERTFNEEAERHSPEQIVKKLRDAGAMLAAGKSVSEPGYGQERWRCLSFPPALAKIAGCRIGSDPIRGRASTFLCDQTPEPIVWRLEEGSLVAQQRAVSPVTLPARPPDFS
jgi:hypothetical protein